ncbi:hypothetical protein CN374_29055 [Bacillus cereus]|nr:hypothetical protein CN374_29055 [Bacillus cereus]
MIGNKKEIHAGNNSMNVQAQNASIQYYGISYSEAKEVAMDVFKSNFYDLGGKVEKLVNERAEEIINRYLEQLEEANPKAITNTEDPDVRFAIYEVQKSYARLGDKDIADLLVDVLVDRTITKERSLLRIVYNEALEIMPKLTSKQIDVLTVIFLIRYVNLGANFSIDYLNEIMTKIANNISRAEFFYQHLQYTGCISMGFGLGNITNILKKHYPNLVPSSTDNEDLIFNENLQNIAPYVHSLVKIWDGTNLCNFKLTSVGIAIALSNFKKKVDCDWDLAVWIREKI